MIENILTVDLEDWYHICGRPGMDSEQQWDGFENRVRVNTIELLELFKNYNIKATFFVLGYIAQKNSSLIEKIHSEGHEIASHGYSHRILTSLTPDLFREDLKKASNIIESIIGVRPKGYRAPSFSITPESKWAFDVLYEEGYLYDSSIFPAKRSDGGFLNMSKEPFDIKLNNGNILKEFPITIGKFLGINLPFSGGGYFRILPYWTIRHFFNIINTKGQPVIFYIHPRDIDSQQPRLKAPFIKTLKTYWGLASTKAKLCRLIKEFKFCPIRNVL